MFYFDLNSNLVQISLIYYSSNDLSNDLCYDLSHDSSKFLCFISNSKKVNELMSGMLLS